MVAAVEPQTDRIIIPTDSEFPDGDDYLASDALQDLGEHLIGTYPELAHLRETTINYTWRKEGGKRGGKAVLGTCTVLSGYARFLSEADFLIALSAAAAREFGLTTRQVEALLFHELLHATFDEKSDKPKIKPHDVEMHLTEVNHYGLWTSDLKDAGDVFRQAELPISVVPFGVRP